MIYLEEFSGVCIVDCTWIEPFFDDFVTGSVSRTFEARFAESV